MKVLWKSSLRKFYRLLRLDPRNSKRPSPLPPHWSRGPAQASLLTSSLPFANEPAPSQDSRAEISTTPGETVFFLDSFLYYGEQFSTEYGGAQRPVCEKVLWLHILKQQEVHRPRQLLYGRRPVNRTWALLWRTCNNGRQLEMSASLQRKTWCDHLIPPSGLDL